MKTIFQSIRSGSTVYLSAFFVLFSISISLAAIEKAYAYDLLLSTSPDRSDPTALAGAAVNGAIHVFTGPDAGVSRVSFYLDDPGMGGSPFRVESYAPYDFAGSSGDNANPYDTGQLSAGSHEITALIDLDGGGSELLSSIFTVAGGSDSSTAYQQETGAEGIVSIEAEHFDADASQGNHAWELVYPVGYSGSAALQAQPNTGANINTGYVSTSPQLDFEVNFVHTGTHYVWVRGNGATLNDDSVHVGLDGSALGSSDRISTFDPSWTWSNATMDGPVATINISSTGVHTVNVWMREDGFVMDKLVLTVDPNYTPTDEGPAESPRGDALTFSPQALMFSVEEGGIAGSQAVDLAASDGGAAAYTISDDADWLVVTPTSGTTPDTLTVTVDAAGLTAGTYTATITADSDDYATDLVAVTLSVTTATTRQLLYSASPDRSAPVPLDGQSLSGMVHVFLSEPADVSRVSFFIDDGAMNGQPYQVDDLAPFDFNGTDQGVVGATGEIVAIEAEHYYRHVSQGGHAWTLTSPTDYAGTGALTALPNNGANTNTGYVTNSPRLDYSVDFPRAGTYYVWSRGIGATLNDDSMHVGLNGNPSASSDRITGFDSVWTWSADTMDGPPASIDVPSAGFHTVNVWMREDGFVLDKLVLTPTASCLECTGQGPDEVPYARAFDSALLFNGEHTIAAMVELNGGATETLQTTFTVDNVPAAFFEDGFSDGTADEWTPVDDDGYQSQWQVSEGAYTQRETIVNPGTFSGSYHLGRYALLGESLGWVDYRFSVDVMPMALRGDDVGVMFRYQDNDNYYRLSISARYGYTRLEKKVNGTFAPLFANARGYDMGTSFNIRVEASGGTLFAYIDGDPVLSMRDASLKWGGVALYTRAEAAFDNVVAETIDPGPAIVISTPIAHSVTPIASLDVKAITRNIPDAGWVEFLLDGGTCGGAVDMSSGTFTDHCLNVDPGDHILTAAINTAGDELAFDLNESIGTSGDYYLAVGDSITNGRGDNFALDNISADLRIRAAQGYQANLADLLSGTSGTPVIIFNEGIGGDESYDAAHTRIDSILDRHPDANKALVMLGTNDSGVPVLSGLGCAGASCNGTYKQNMQLLVDKLTTEGKAVYVALVPPVFTAANPLNAARNNLIREYNAVIETELANIEPQRPDVFDFFLNASTNRFSLFADELHPNSLGYVVLSKLWQNALTDATDLPFILDDLSPSTVAPFLKQNLIEVGDACYVDESYVISRIPAGFEDGRWIMTANGDRTNMDDNYLSFHTDASVTVYVAYDAGASALPDWLSTGFLNTGLQINTSNPDAPSMRLYASNGSMGGDIQLGGNLAAGASGAQAQYLVIVINN